MPCCGTGACCCHAGTGRCACQHPLVSVITPTWRRHEHLLRRCIPSVQVQLYPNLEHIVVSDGPDAELAQTIAGMRACEHPACPRSEPWCQRLRYAELDEHPAGEHWGGAARRRGLEIARGDYIAYLDDDDLYLPRHCAILAAALNAHPEAGFAYSRMQWADGTYLIGTDEPMADHIGTPMIMHRREILEHGTWGEPDEREDWHLVERWMRAGVRWHFVPRMTVLVWPGAESVTWTGT